MRVAAALLPIVLGLAVPAAPASGQSADDEHPHVRLVKEYRAASRAGDAEALGRLLADDARIWFGEKNGEGRKLDPLGKGPWAAWDEFFHATSEALEFAVEDQGVRVTNLEINDWYRLIDRKPVPYYIDYFIDGSGRISGKLIRGIEGIEREPDRLEQFEAWARRTHPGLLERLMPEGEIDPAPDKARLWRRYLVAWRHDVGLPGLPD